jgi:hypothetical protein
MILADPNTRKALDVSTKYIPLGWKPGIKIYPLRRYKRLLKLWRMQTDLDETQKGAAIIGRLEGPAFQFALSLKQTRYDWRQHAKVTLSSPDFLEFPRDPAAIDDVNGKQIPEFMSGFDYMGKMMTEGYEADDQDEEWASLEAYFDLVQGASTIESYISTHSRAFSDAQDISKLSISYAGKTFFLLRAASLSGQQLTDIRMRVGGDLFQYSQINQLIVKIHGNSSEDRSSTKPLMATQYYGSARACPQVAADTWYEAW